MVGSEESCLLQLAFLLILCTRQAWLVSPASKRRPYFVCGLWLHGSVFLLGVFDVLSHRQHQSDQVSSQTPKCYFMRFRSEVPCGGEGTRSWGGPCQWQAHTHFTTQEEQFSLRGVGLVSFSSNPFRECVGGSPVLRYPFPAGWSSETALPANTNYSQGFLLITE